MEISFAPMEGITGHTYRRVHHEVYGDSVDRYFTPFIVATYTKSYKTREKEDARPENNTGIPTVPQILSNNAGEFLHAAGWLREMGYREINLNLGCPVSTVVSKNRGSGFLRVPLELDRFLDEVFQNLPPDMKLGVKTRIGFESAAEAPDLYALFRDYPLSELIIHPRTRAEMYSGLPHLETFALAADLSEKFPICYNGNIDSAEDYALITERFDWISGVMIGRGLISDPGLAARLRGNSEGARKEDSEGPCKEKGEGTDDGRIRVFHNALYAEYKKMYLSFRDRQGDAAHRSHGRAADQHPSGERVLVNRMKEIWAYMGRVYAGSERYMKEIRKARSCVEYEAAVRMLMNNCRVDHGNLRGFPKEWTGQQSS